MTPDRYQQIKTICSQVLDAPAGERESMIRSHCSGDFDVEYEVRQLLSGIDTGGFLDGAPLPLGAMQRVLDSLLSPLKPGELLAGRFRISKLLGQGGMGQVWEAHDQELDEAVAIKMIRPEIASDVPTVARFKREVLNARRVTHPHVCRVFDLFVHHGPYGEMPFLTMQLLRGDTLAEWLKQPAKPRTRPWVEDVLRQCAEALDSAHAAGVIHRDFKPGNVMLVTGGDGTQRAMVTDFGLALATSSSVRSGRQTLLTTPGAGTPGYMPPEQSMGRELTPAADVYSFGVVACELLTGKLPEDGGLKLVPAAWREPLRVALDPDPNARFRCASDCLAAVSKNTISRRFGWLALALVAITTSALGWHFYPQLRSAVTPPEDARSLAILPFDTGGSAADELLSVGLAGELYSVLTSVRNLRVVATESSLLRQSTLDLSAVGYRLQANMLLKGSIRRDHERIRVSAHLVDPETRRVVWAQTFERGVSETSQLHADIAQGLVKHLGLAAQAARTSLFARQTPHAEAHDLFLRGREQWTRRGPDNLRAALAAFDEAIQLDPQFALAWAARADTLANLAEVSVLPGSEAFPKAREAALRAIMLDPNLPEALAALGLIYSIGDWDLYNARLNLERALQLQPGSLYAHMWYGSVLTKLGQHDLALREAKIAQALDPLSPRQLLSVGWANVYARRFAEGLAVAKQLERDFPSHIFNCLLTAHSYLGLSDVPAAVIAVDGCAAGFKKVASYAGVRGLVMARAGRVTEANRCINEILAMRSSSPVAHTQLASVFAALGQRNEAFYWLDQAAIHRDPLTVYVPYNQAYDSIRDDPRYATFLERIGLFKGSKP